MMHKKKTISISDWPEFEKYLIIRANYTDNKKNIESVKSKFNSIAKWYMARKIPFDIESFTEFLYDKKLNGCNGKGASDAYLNKFRTVGIQLAKWVGIKEFVLKYTTEEQNNDFDILTPEEIEQIACINIQYGKGGDYLNRRNKVMYLVAGLIGPRPGEMCNIRWNDVHFDGTTWVIVFKKTKTKKQRKCVIGRRLGEMLQELPHLNQEFVFASYRGKQLTTHEYNLEIQRRAKACGIKKPVNGKLLRHSAITNMFSIDMDGYDVSTTVGHDNPETTKRYKHNDTNYFYKQLLPHKFLARERTGEIDQKMALELLEKYFSHRRKEIIIDEKTGKMLVEIDFGERRE